MVVSGTGANTVRRFRNAVALVTSLTCLDPSRAGAQHAGLGGTMLVDGERVRITSRDGTQCTGRLALVGRDSLSVIPDSGPTPCIVAASSLPRVELSMGMSDRMRRSAGIGMIVGGVIGGVAAHVSYQKPEPTCAKGEFLCVDFSDLDRAMSEMLGALIGFGLGGVVGAALGSRPVEEWRTVTVHGTALRFGLAAPSAGGIGVSAHFPF